MEGTWSKVEQPSISQWKVLDLLMKGGDVRFPMYDKETRTYESLLHRGLIEKVEKMEQAHGRTTTRIFAVITEAGRKAHGLGSPPATLTKAQADLLATVKEDGTVETWRTRGETVQALRDFGYIETRKRYSDEQIAEMRSMMQRNAEDAKQVLNTNGYDGWMAALAILKANETLDRRVDETATFITEAGRAFLVTLKKKEATTA